MTLDYHAILSLCISRLQTTPVTILHNNPPRCLLVITADQHSPDETSPSPSPPQLLISLPLQDLRKQTEKGQER